MRTILCTATARPSGCRKRDLPGWEAHCACPRLCPAHGLCPRLCPAHGLSRERLWASTAVLCAAAGAGGAPGRPAARPQALGRPRQAQALAALAGGPAQLRAWLRGAGVLVAAHGPYTAAGAGPARARARVARACLFAAWRCWLVHFTASPARPCVSRPALAPLAHIPSERPHVQAGGSHM